MNATEHFGVNAT